MTILQSGVIPASGGYEISRSLRFNPADSAYLNRTFGSGGSRTTWTLSVWVKRSAIGVNHAIISCGSYSTDLFQFFFEDATNSLRIQNFPNSTTANVDLLTSAVYRDLSAWYHIVAVMDTTQATSSNRVKLYVNGSQVTAFSTATYPAQNATPNWNTGSLAHLIGARSAGVLQYSGYMTEVYFIDGQALTPSSFGQTNAGTGVWEPVKYTGTYGTNGFYLKFLPSYSGGSISADFLVVAGGGGGGKNLGGGGGAGGYREFSAQTLTVGTAYTVTVGAGGAGSSNTSNGGASGSNSVFSTNTSAGGGGGASNTGAGSTGGSGGGAVRQTYTTGYAGNTPSTSPSQGNKGGDTTGIYSGGGGGGGAGAAGSNAGNNSTTYPGGNGGLGTPSSITGSAVSRGGGGGGGANSSGSQGTGSDGGGNGGWNGGAPTAGSANTGGGGGGGGNDANNGQSGGSGVVIIKIPSQYSANFTSGVTYSISTAVSGFKIYTVTATSTTSETVTFV